MTFSYQDNDFLFSAEFIEATFPNTNDATTETRTWQPTIITVQKSIPIGINELILTDFNENDNDNNNNNGQNLSTTSSSTRRSIRFIFISPQQDWRRNQTYLWKLDNVWMSSDDFLWLHWNAESYIDSVIQIPQLGSANEDNKDASSAIIFTCDLLEFHFRPIGVVHYSNSDELETNKVILKNVQIAACLPTTNDNNNNSNNIKKTEQFVVSKKMIYSPCSSISSDHDRHTCSIVNGEIVNGTLLLDSSFQQSFMNLFKEARDFGVGLPVAILVVVLFGGICCCCCCVYRLITRWKQYQLYHELSPSLEEDELKLTVEDTYYDKDTEGTMSMKQIYDKRGRQHDRIICHGGIYVEK